ncbi:alpha/beta hydrolase, partial [Patescibacteria group bacterium]|nr:alpha/beta hydrolase [Patescibacteria group bacterium]
PRLPGFDAPTPKIAWELKDYSNLILNQANKKWNKKKFVIFGHSFGGRIAIKLAHRNPPNLAGVVLCAAGGLSRGNPIKRAILFVLAKLGKIFLFFMPFALVWKKFLYKIAREHDYEKTRGVMRDTFRKVINENLKPLIQFIEVPVLILWGKNDTTTPFADALFIKKTLSKSKLVSFKNDGHKLPYEKPSELAKEIDRWVSNGIIK